jgi:preprotein translocase subunit SecD
MPQQVSGGYVSKFEFGITLSADAAQKHAEITKSLGTNSTNPGYLEKPLDLYLDDNLVESLMISEDLKGRVTTQISISGSGSGETQEDAVKAAEEEMHKLQTILITGSLPYKLEIVKLDTISPVLGDEFTGTILIAGIVALLSASLIVFIRYRKIKSSLALILISFSEVIIILGVASVIEWNLDLPSIAGILAAIGTGFDDQIVILDEARGEKFLSIKQRLKRAFAIILGAYFTAAVSILPLLWAGAGLLKGFAFTTLIGISIGVFITRPAFSDIVKKIEKD